MPTETNHPPQPNLYLVLECIALGCLAFLIHLPNINHGLYVDELYHLIPAQSLIDGHGLRLGDGEYTRVAFYTHFVSYLQSYFGDGALPPRLSSLFFMSVAISLIYVWTKAHLGRFCAIFVFVALLTSPSIIYISQFVRFYAAHFLVVTAAAYCTYIAAVRYKNIRVSLIWAVLALALLAVGYYLQTTTSLLSVGLALWVLGYIFLVVQPFGSILQSLKVFAILVVLGLGALLIAGANGMLSNLWNEYRFVAEWAAERRDDVLYYHRLFRHQYPAFWQMFPLAVLLAVAARPRPAIFLITVFTTALALHSFGGMKDERYTIYLLPYFFCISSIATLVVGEFCLKQLNNALVGFGASKKFSRFASRSLIGLAALFLLLSTPAVTRSGNLLAGQPYRYEMGDWSLANTLASSVRQAAVVVSTQEVESIYFFGRSDFTFSAARLQESVGLDLNSSKQYVVDRRTGKPVVSNLEELKLIVACYANGIFLGSREKWSKPTIGLGKLGSLWVEDNLVKIETPDDASMVAYKWDTKKLAPGAECIAPYSHLN